MAVRRWKRKWGNCLLAAAALASAPATAAAQAYNEAISGDLSNDPQAPTTIGTLRLGSTTLTGETIPSGEVVGPHGEYSIQDNDYATFSVAAGQQLTGLFVGAGTSIIAGDRMFLGIARGATVNLTHPDFSSAEGLLGWTLVPASAIGTNILPALGNPPPPDFAPIGGAEGFTGPLSAGTYTLWMLSGENPVRYSFDLVTQPVPEPASWALMVAGFGLAGVAVRRAKRRPSGAFA